MASINRRRSWLQRTKHQLGEQTLRVFFAELRPLRAMTVWLYLLGVIGFQFPPMSADVGLEFLGRIFDYDTWTLLFLYPCISRVWALYVWEGNLFFRMFTASLGIWLWSILMIAEYMAGFSFLSPFIVVFISTEVWILAQYLTYRLDDLKQAHAEPPRVL